MAPFAVKLMEPVTQIVNEDGLPETVVTGAGFTVSVTGLLTLVVLQLSFTVSV